MWTFGYAFLLSMLAPAYVLAQGKDSAKLSGGDNILTNVFDNDLRICALVPAKQKGMVDFYEYNFGKHHHGVYALKQKPTWSVPEYGARGKPMEDIYSRIRKNEPIKDVIIDTLDLGVLAQKKGEDWVIPYSLTFLQVYVKAIKFPDATTLERGKGPKDAPNTIGSKLIFKENVRIHQCSLEQFRCDDAVFEKDVFLTQNSLVGFFEPIVTFTNCEFKGEFIMLNDYPGQILVELGWPAYTASLSDRNFIRTEGKRMFATYYKDDGLFGRPDLKQPKYSFAQSCQFDGDVIILNNNPWVYLDFSTAVFKGKTFMTHFYPRYRRIRGGGTQLLNPTFYSPETDLYKDDPLCNVNFSSAQFARPVSLNNEWVNNVIFNDALFADTVELINTSFRDTVRSKRGLPFAHFSERQTIVVNPGNFSLANINISPAIIKTIDIPYFSTNHAITPYSRSYLDNYITFYDRLTGDIKLTYAQQPDVATDLQNKFNHQQIVYKTAYLWHHPGIGNSISWLWYSFLEWTVGNGYNGGSNFLMSSLIVILIFSAIYFLFHRREFIAFVNAVNSDDKEEVKSYEPKAHAANFIKCFWQSFIIFFSPKFGFNYFRLSGRLFAILVVEWLFGVLMIVLFLIYVATTYPFIRALLGL
jgi:hypothetical protein